MNSLDNGNRYENSIITSADYALIAQVDELDLELCNIRDMTGIDIFTGLVYLYCAQNCFTQLDLSSLSNLEMLDCSYNNLSSLILPINGVIGSVDCCNCFMSSLNISNLTSLGCLYCNNNDLTSLDVGSCPNLYYLWCEYNHLTCLDIESLNYLCDVHCSWNELTSLTLGPAVTRLICPVNSLVKLDISNATNLRNLDCSINRISVLNICNYTLLTQLSTHSNEFNDETDILKDYNNITPYTGSNSFVRRWDNCPFYDIPDDYRIAIKYVYTHDYMDGVTSTYFYPNNYVTRGELASVLYKVAGTPDVSSVTIPFTDVLSTSEYYDAVRWVYSEGVMSGATGTLFDLNGTIDRESAAVVFDDFVQAMPYSFDYIRTSYVFDDNSDISSWASSSVDKMYRYGVFDYHIEVNGGYQFDPSSILTRKDLAVLVRRFETIALYL